MKELTSKQEDHVIESGMEDLKEKRKLKLIDELTIKRMGLWKELELLGEIKTLLDKGELKYAD